jgi:hypothetical protein
MKHLYVHKGQLVTAINGASDNIKIGKQYKIKKIEKRTINETITIDLDHLVNYPFDQGTFIYYFGDSYFKKDNLNKNIKIL